MSWDIPGNFTVEVGQFIWIENESNQNTKNRSNNNKNLGEKYSTVLHILLHGIIIFWSTFLETDPLGFLMFKKK